MGAKPQGPRGRETQDACQADSIGTASGRTLHRLRRKNGGLLLLPKVSGTQAGELASVQDQEKDAAGSREGKERGYQMTIDRVEEMLKSYRYAVGRCGHIAQEIKTLRAQYATEKHDVLVAIASPKPQQITDMPHGTTVGNPTEKHGLMLASGYASEEMKELEAAIAKLEDEYYANRAITEYVESWLKGLNERERWIVETQVIDGVFWRDVGVQYAARFGESVSKDTLKRIRDKAMEKIYSIAK